MRTVQRLIPRMLISNRKPVGQALFLCFTILLTVFINVLFLSFAEFLNCNCYNDFVKHLNKAWTIDARSLKTFNYESQFIFNKWQLHTTEK